MADETFGPSTRQPINPSEFANAQQNPALADSIGWNQVSENRRQLSADLPEMQNQPKFSGNLPPELAARMQKAQESEKPMKVAENSRMNTKKKNTREIDNQPSFNLTGSSKLQELIKGATDSSQVYEKITLPSLGKFYNGEDGPTDGIIHIRPMTGEEEAILATPRFVKRGDAMNLIFDKCIKESYESNNFLTVDITYLMIWLRGISYSPEYRVELVCPFTDNKFEYAIDLNLDVETCPDNFNASSLQGVLPTTGYSFSYRLARGYDQLAIKSHREKKAKFDNSAKTDDSLLFTTALLIEDIEGLGNKQELEILLGKLPVSDGNLLRNLVNFPPFGVETKITVTSPYTLENFEIELPFDSNFFFPRLPKREK
jgi:hypothetical protein